MESKVEDAESLIRYRIVDKDFRPKEGHHNIGGNEYVADYREGN
jgi:hypothetical protein